MLHLSVIQFLIKPVFVVAIFTVCACAANAQRRIPGPVDASNIETADQQLSPMEEEMRVKRQLEASNKAHKENVNRARNLVSLSESVVSAYKANNHLSREDLKNLERAEKLVKKIRDEAGGSDPETDPDEHPSDMASALNRLREVADSLKQRVEKTPKQVVSAAIIDEANVLLELIRIVRAMHARTT